MSPSDSMYGIFPVDLLNWTFTLVFSSSQDFRISNMVGTKRRLFVELRIVTFKKIN
jgi:hypothetical protein